MRLRIPFIAFALVGCTAQVAPSDEIWMDAIEANEVLPDGAREIDDYGRNYAFNGAIIVGHYVAPAPPLDQDIGCERMTLDGGTEPCDGNWHESYESSLSRQLQAGERRWYESVEALPNILDGGCKMITILYNPETRQFPSVTCNGRA